METPAVPAKAIVAALERILVSPQFARAPRAADLLRYLVGKWEAGQAGEIKEYTIALELFGRASYDSRTDSLVRVEVAKLRELLKKYYESDGRNDPVRIDIPKGGYVPVFERRRPAKSLPRLRLASWATVVALSLSAVAVWRWASRPAAAPAPAGPVSIAVLPFVDMSQSKDLEYFCDGLTDELIRTLAAEKGLRVASRTSVFKYKGQAMDVRRIGAELDVQAVLEGSVRVVGHGALITVQLINTRSGFHLWTGAYERDIRASLGIEKEIAQAVAKAFRVSLHDTTRALARPGTADSDAWHYYMMAAHEDNDAEMARAIELYQAAIASDPNYALAWAGLSLALTTHADWREVPPAEAIPRAAHAARRAVALDSRLAKAQQALGRIKVFYERDWAGAERAFRRGIELDPTNVDIRYDYARLVLNTNGRFSEAISELERGIALAPAMNHLRNELAGTYIKARRWQEAAPHLESSLKLSPDAPAVFVLKGMVASGRGNLEDALRLYREAALRKPSAWIQAHIGYTLAKLGRAAEARQLLTELQAASSQVPADYEMAVILAALGEKEAAFAGLERALAGYSMSTPWLKVDFLLEDLCGDPRFKKLLRKMRLG